MAAGKSGLSSSSLLLASVPPLLACMLLALPWDWTGVVRYGADAIVRDDTLPPGAHQSLATDAYTRTTQHFSSHGEQLEGWLYVPSNKEHSSPRPCVIMAHGLGGQKDFGLHRFGERFVQEGFTTLVFDYRCFGGSSGEPRNWISPRRHVEDWMSAVKALQPGGELSRREGIVCSSIVLWGTSFSGGHVLEAAARLGPEANISAVVSQIPHLSGIEASLGALRLRGLLRTLRMLALGLHDLMRSKLGLSAAYVRIVGRPTDAALMLLEEAEEKGYYAKHPPVKRGGWTPWAPARLTLEISRYSPVQQLSKIKSPILFVAATRDALCPAKVVRRAAHACGRHCQLLEVDVDHFNVYSGMAFLNVTDETVNFMLRHAL